MPKYRYVLLKDYKIEHPSLQGILFSNQWVIICRGTMIIKKGYAWDGCSPSWYFAGRWWGTPDGWITSESIPVTYYASLVHDALCQFKNDIPIKKQHTVTIFCDLMKRDEWPFADIYAFAVDKLGPQRFKGDVT